MCSRIETLSLHTVPYMHVHLRLFTGSMNASIYLLWNKGDDPSRTKEKTALPRPGQISLFLFQALGTYYTPLCRVHSGDQLTCCERVNHHESAARFAVVLQFMEIPSVFSGQVKDVQRISCSGWHPKKKQSKVEPAGWEQEHLIWLRFFRVSEWMVEIQHPPIRGIPQLLIRSSSLDIFLFPVSTSHSLLTSIGFAQHHLNQ